jgi:hypothetical protein
LYVRVTEHTLYFGEDRRRENQSMGVGHNLQKKLAGKA